MKQTVQMGGYGVEKKLTHFGNTADTYWSPRHNSFVVAEDSKGPWLMEDGTQVRLYSINGIGEIRWEIKPLDAQRSEGEGYYDGDEGADAADYFGLTPR